MHLRSFQTADGASGMPASSDGLDSVSKQVPPARQKAKKNNRLGWFSLATPIGWGSISLALVLTKYSDLRNRSSSSLEAGQDEFQVISG